ncbi:hypothetical protein CUMW_149740, partial [Citrus unshiu]
VNTLLSGYGVDKFLLLSQSQKHNLRPSVAVAVLMDWSFVHKTWEKWASTSVGSSGEPLKAALLINQDPTVQNKKGIKADAIDLTEFVDFVKLNKLQTDCFVIGQKNQCKLFVSPLHL